MRRQLLMAPYSCWFCIFSPGTFCERPPRVATFTRSEITRLAGVNTRRLQLLVYTVAGVFYGIAALLLVARTGVGDPNAGQTDNLSSITAVVLGGTSLFGGRGAILGTLVGV